MSLPFDLPLLQSLAMTAAISFSVMVANRLAAMYIARRRTVLTPEQRRRLAFSRAVSSSALVIGILIIWRSELQTLLVSLAAMVVALIIVSKELIQGAIATLISSASGSVRIGDWIEVGGVHGEVVDRSLMTTTLNETGDGTFGYAYTGRRLVISNFQLFSTGARRQRFGREFVRHRVTVIFDRGPSNAEALHVWRSEAVRLCQPFSPAAERALTAIEGDLGATVGSHEPRTRISTTELGKVCLEAELLCPTGEAGQIEAHLKTSLLDWLSASSSIATFDRRFDNANANSTPSLQKKIAGGEAA
jgi:hypothetical protein